MNRLLFIPVLCLLFSFVQVKGQEDPVEKGLHSVTEDVLKAQLGFLASNWTEGRETGEKGEYLAADYIASIFQLYGIKPGGDYPQARGYENIQKGKERTYFQNYVLLRTVPGDEQVLELKTTSGKSTEITSFTYNIDFTLRPPEAGTEIDAPVVFAGYGFKSDKLKYNDYSGLDVKGKFVLRISGTPDFAKELLTPSELSASSDEATAYLKSKGALGIIEYNPYSNIVGRQPERDFMNMSPSENNPRSYRIYAKYSIPGKSFTDYFPRIFVSLKTANEILKGTGFSTEEYIKRSGTHSDMKVPVITDRSVHFRTTVKTETVRTRNIIGVIEGKDPDKVVVIGAHYDHLGMSNGYIWNGADDNGSGTVGVMTLAKAFMETGEKPARTIIFALWSGEEEGLLGSRYYIDNLQYPLKNLRLNANFDMISRYISDSDPKKVIMTYTESYPLFRTITEENIKKYGIDLLVDYQPSMDPPGGSDHRSFAAAGIPILRFKPGHREEYHTPADETGTVNWDIMEKIIKISFADLWELSNSDW